MKMRTSEDNVSAEIHAAVAASAEAAGKSLNQWAAEMLNKATQT
ncbi:MAG: toxin-antitoxin system HicB family antitoxin [Deltaproteobacteria bacterium]|jgi:predicted HicB family RNase H-like nuclease